MKSPPEWDSLLPLGCRPCLLGRAVKGLGEIKGVTRSLDLGQGAWPGTRCPTLVPEVSVLGGGLGQPSLVS